MKEIRRVTVNEIAARLDMSHGSAHHIVHDVLQFIYIFIQSRFSFHSPSYLRNKDQQDALFSLNLFQ